MLKIVTSLFFFVFISLPSAQAAQDWQEIKAQATLAEDAYLAPSNLTQALKKQGQTLQHTTTLDHSQVSYFLSSAEGVQSLSIRGTDNVENAIVDLNLTLTPNKQLGIKLHQGFGLAAKAIYDDVAPHLSKTQPINITGHSLGGAIAVVLAMYLEQHHYHVAQIITFGQPKVTNVTGANKFADLPLTRVVTLHDIVPLVPPLSPMQIKDMDIFWHMGTEVILEGNKKYAVTSGLKSMLRATKFTSSIPNERNLQAHKMSTYLQLIDGLQHNPVKTPYKAGIHLFGISID